MLTPSLQTLVAHPPVQHTRLVSTLYRWYLTLYFTFCQCGLLTTRSLTRVLSSTPVFGAMCRRLRTVLAVPAAAGAGGGRAERPCSGPAQGERYPLPLSLCPSISLILLEAGSRPCLRGERAVPALSKTRSRPRCLQGERAVPALSKTRTLTPPLSAR